MKVGVAFPNLGRLARPSLLDNVADRVEGSGVADLWVGDHVAYPTTVAFPYPSYPGFSMPATDPILDPLAVLAYLASRTRDVRLGVSVLIVPYRNPVLTARLVATIDVLSAGRITCGVGAGWFAEEFEVLGADFDHRGSVTEEYLQLMSRLWTEESVTFHGRFYSCSSVGMQPKPVQRPLPIWMGGSGASVLQRAARIADGWQPMAPEIERYDAGRETLERALSAQGRQAERFTLSVRLIWGGDATSTSTGPPGLPAHVGALVEVLGAYARVGAEHVLLTLRAATAEEYLDLLDRVIRDVVPAADQL